MKNLNICIIGGTGFVGSHLCAELVKRGHRVKVLTRQREQNRHLLVLPSLQLVQANVHSENELKQHFENCDVVINLIGILNEKRHDGSGFHMAHVELARKVITICSTCKVPRLLHMSALNASPDEKSFYLRTKGEAENYVHTFAANKIAVTSFRPSVIFGAEDSFVNRFANLLKFTPLALPLACSKTQFAPVYVDDVAQVMADSIDDTSTFDQRINLCGPKRYSLKELVKYISHVSNQPRIIIGLPNWASKLQANILEYFPGKPFSKDNYLSLQKDSICPDASTCSTSMESIVPKYINNDPHHERMETYRAKR